MVGEIRVLPPSTPIFSDPIVLLQNNNCVAIVSLSLSPPHSLAIIFRNVPHIVSHNKLTK